MTEELELNGEQPTVDVNKLYEMELKLINGNISEIERLFNAYKQVIIGHDAVIVGQKLYELIAVMYYRRNTLEQNLGME